MRTQVTVVLLEIVLTAVCTASSDFDEARRQQDAGRYAEAEKLYGAVLKTKPRSVPALTNLGVVLARQGKFGEAVTAYKKALQLAPDLVPVKMNLGIVLYQTEQYAEAADWFQKVLKVNPSDGRARHLLAVCYLQTSRYHEAAEHFSKLLPSEDVSLNVGAATALLKIGRQAEGEALLRKTLEGQDRSPEIHLMMGQAHLGLNQPEQAAQSFQKMVTLAPSRPDGHFYLGGSYFKQGELSKALAEWRLAARLDSQYFPAAFAIGALLAGQRNFDEGREWLMRALALRPNHGATRFELGRLCYRQKNYEEALPQLLEATKQQPELKEASYLLANTYRSLGKEEEAQKEFLRYERLQKSGLRHDSDLMQAAVDGTGP